MARPDALRETFQGIELVRLDRTSNTFLFESVDAQGRIRLGRCLAPAFGGSSLAEMVARDPRPTQCIVTTPHDGGTFLVVSLRAKHLGDLDSMVTGIRAVIRNFTRSDGLEIR